MIVSQFGVRSKKSGYARVSAAPAAPSVSALVLHDKRVDRLARAKQAERYVYGVQGFNDSPDYFTSEADLATATQITNTNPSWANTRGVARS